MEITEDLDDMGPWVFSEARINSYRSLGHQAIISRQPDRSCATGQAQLMQERLLLTSWRITSFPNNNIMTRSHQNGELWLVQTDHHGKLSLHHIYTTLGNLQLFSLKAGVLQRVGFSYIQCEYGE